MHTPTVLLLLNDVQADSLYAKAESEMYYKRQAVALNPIFLFPLPSSIFLHLMGIVV